MTVGGPSTPVLEGDALAAVRHRGTHMQIIAAAGSGKTEVVSQRVVDLLAEGVAARGIVAFTFTERAAEELKNRINRRVEERLGRTALDLARRTVRRHHPRVLLSSSSSSTVPRLPETYDVLDDNQLTAFLTREANRLAIRQLDPAGRDRLFAAIEAFLKSVDVVENELLDPTAMPEPFQTVLTDYFTALERYRLLTYGQQIVRAVRELERPEVAATVHSELRHLIVDEYQDVNPAQERLIELLAGPAVHLCVVGDDDQAIYQWRGSDVANIVSFADRYPTSLRFTIIEEPQERGPTSSGGQTSSRPPFPAGSRRPMEIYRPAGGGPRSSVWYSPTELEEAGWIAQMILDLADEGVLLSRHRRPRSH